VRTHAVLVIGLYELLDNPTTLLIEPPEPNGRQRIGNKLHNTTEKTKAWATKTPEWTQLLWKGRQFLYHWCAIILLWAKCQMVWDSLLFLLLWAPCLNSRNLCYVWFQGFKWVASRLSIVVSYFTYIAVYNNQHY
jgi:hypothetical protein